MHNIIEDLTQVLERASLAHEILDQCCHLWKEMPEHLRKEVRILQEYKRESILPVYRRLQQRDAENQHLLIQLRAAEEKIKSLEKKTS